LAAEPALLLFKAKVMKGIDFDCDDLAWCLAAQLLLRQPCLVAGVVSGDRCRTLGLHRQVWVDADALLVLIGGCWVGPCCMQTLLQISNCKIVQATAISHAVGADTVRAAVVHF